MTVDANVILPWSLAFAGSLLFVPASKYLGHRFGLVSNPRLFGKSEKLIPNVGGLGLAAAVALGFYVQNRLAHAAIALLVGAVLACVLGLADDRIVLLSGYPGRRLFLQGGIAALAWLADFKADASGLVGLLGTLVLLVAAMNSFNLLDNMDGVAGVTGAITAAGVAILALMGGQSMVATLAASLSGACLGFLVFNFHHASVYLGNGGSLLIGFLIGGAVLKLRLPLEQPWALIGGVSILAVPFTDTALVIASRILAKRPVMSGGTDHISHRLVRLGTSTRVSALVHGLAAFAASSSVALAVVVSPELVLIPPLLFGACALLLLMVPVYQEHPKVSKA